MSVLIYCNSLSTVQWRFRCHSAAICGTSQTSALAPRRLYRI